MSLLEGTTMHGHMVARELGGRYDQVLEVLSGFRVPGCIGKGGHGAFVVSSSLDFIIYAPLFQELAEELCR